jgi:RecB family endonuclease NucS
VVHNSYGEIIEDALNFFKFKNPKGKILKFNKQKDKDIKDRIDKYRDRGTDGEKVEAKVAEAIQEKNKKVEGIGVGVEREDGTKAGDLDVTTADEIIEAKRSIGKVDVDQLKKYFDLNHDGNYPAACG